MTSSNVGLVAFICQRCGRRLVETFSVARVRRPWCGVWNRAEASERKGLRPAPKQARFDLDDSSGRYRIAADL